MLAIVSISIVLAVLGILFLIYWFAGGFSAPSSTKKGTASASSTSVPEKKTISVPEGIGWGIFGIGCVYFLHLFWIMFDIGSKIPTGLGSYIHWQSWTTFWFVVVAVGFVRMLWVRKKKLDSEKGPQKNVSQQRYRKDGSFLSAIFYLVLIIALSYHLGIIPPNVGIDNCIRWALDFRVFP